MKEQPQKQTDVVKKEKKWLKRLIIFAVATVIIAVSIIAYLGISAEQDESELSMRNVQTVTIPSFTINLVDAGHRRYLRTQITLEFTDKNLATELQLKNHRIKDTIISILRSKAVTDLDTTEKGDLVRQELIDALNFLLVEGKITGLYFEEFIIQ